MKKILAFLLAMIILFSFVACIDEISSVNEDTTPSSLQSKETIGRGSDEDEKLSVNEDTTASSPQSVETTDDSSAKNNTSDKEDNEITFEETVVIDSDVCVIKITEIDPDNRWGYCLKVQLENKSADKTYRFSVESAAINGVQCDPYFSTKVAAGKKATDKISFTDSSLEENDIGEYTDIELTFRVYDSNDWSADDVVRATVHVYPYGEDKAVAFVRESQSSDNTIIDNEHVTVTVIGYEMDDIWGYKVNLFLQNKTDATVRFSVDDVSVNGYMAEPYYSDSVSAGKCAFSSISWSHTTLKKNGITEIEEIEAVFSAYDADDWFDDDFVNQVITLNP